MIVTKVVDGDTVHGNVDLGFGIVFNDMTFRFSGINAPEIHGPTADAGNKSKQHVIDTVLNKEVFIITKKDSQEKYGRFLAEIFYKDATGNYVSLNKEMVTMGLAKEFMV